MLTVGGWSVKSVLCHNFCYVVFKKAVPELGTSWKYSAKNNYFS